MDHSITPVHSYRATLIPASVAADEAELRSTQATLPTIQLKARNASVAEQLAFRLTGRPVLQVERISEVFALAPSATHRLTYAPAFLPCGTMVGHEINARKHLTVTARSADAAVHAAEQVTGRLVVACQRVHAAQQVAA